MWSGENASPPPPPCQELVRSPTSKGLPNPKTHSKKHSEHPKSTPKSTRSTQKALRKALGAPKKHSEKHSEQSKKHSEKHSEQSKKNPSEGHLQCAKLRALVGARSNAGEWWRVFAGRGGGVFPENRLPEDRRSLTPLNPDCAARVLHVPKFEQGVFEDRNPPSRPLPPNQRCPFVGCLRRNPG